MKLMAAIFTLLIALLLLGEAYSGYQENARIASTQFAAYPDRFATRSAEGLTIQQGEEQGRLATAGLEGLLGIALLFAAVILCGPAERAPNTGDYNLRKAATPPRPEPTPSPTTDRGTLSQSGRRRIEELRTHRPTSHRTIPAPLPTPIKPILSDPGPDLPG